MIFYTGFPALQSATCQLLQVLIGLLDDDYDDDDDDDDDNDDDDNEDDDDDDGLRKKIKFFTLVT